MHQVRFGYSFVRGTQALALASVTCVVATTARADVVGFDPSGGNPTPYTGTTTTGGSGAWIDGHGSGFVIVQPNPADAYNFLFVETGAYELTRPDGVSALGTGTRDTTLTYSVFGTLDVRTGLATFSGGMVNLYSDANFNFGSINAGPQVVYGANDGTLIASFAIGSGGGAVGGTATLQATSVAGSVQAGYFHAANGTDLASTQAMNLTVQIGNAIDLSPSSPVVSEIVCKAAAFPGPGCVGGSYANTPYYFVVTDHAQALLSAVPEPSTALLALAGVGLIFGVSKRRGASR